MAKRKEDAAGRRAKKKITILNKRGSGGGPLQCDDPDRQLLAQHLLSDADPANLAVMLAAPLSKAQIKNGCLYPYL